MMRNQESTPRQRANDIGCALIILVVFAFAGFVYWLANLDSSNNAQPIATSVASQPAPNSVATENLLSIDSVRTLVREDIKPFTSHPETVEVMSCKLTARPKELSETEHLYYCRYRSRTLLPGNPYRAEETWKVLVQTSSGWIVHTPTYSEIPYLTNYR